QLDEVAGPVPVVELILKDAVPGIAARSRRTRETEDECFLGQSRTGAGLNGRGSDLLERDHVKDGRETVDLLVEKRSYGIGRHVPASKAGSAGRDNNVDSRICDPAEHACPDLSDVIPDDGPLGNFVARLLDQLHQGGARLVLADLARVRDGKHRNGHGYERARLVNS